MQVGGIFSVAVLHTSWSDSCMDGGHLDVLDFSGAQILSGHLAPSRSHPMAVEKCIDHVFLT